MPALSTRTVHALLSRYCSHPGSLAHASSSQQTAIQSFATSRATRHPNEVSLWLHDWLVRFARRHVYRRATTTTRVSKDNEHGLDHRRNQPQLPCQSRPLHSNSATFVYCSPSHLQRIFHRGSRQWWTQPRGPNTSFKVRPSPESTQFPNSKNCSDSGTNLRPLNPHLHPRQQPRHDMHRLAPRLHPPNRAHKKLPRPALLLARLVSLLRPPTAHRRPVLHRLLLCAEARLARRRCRPWLRLRTQYQAPITPRVQVRDEDRHEHAGSRAV